MPRYELMYILASSVSDDLVPETTETIEQFVESFGGTNVEHDKMGKKKLAYPIKKTRNGHYGVITFSAKTKAITQLDAKIRTQGKTIIRHLITNIDEHLDRKAKDAEVQAQMNKNRPPERAGEDNSKQPDPKPKATPKPKAKKATPAPVAEKTDAPKKETSTKDIDQEIEKALTEDITK